MITVVGAVIGAVFAVGLVTVVRAAPPSRPIRLIDRVAPYLGDTPAPSRLLGAPAVSAPAFAVARRVFGPALAELTRLLDRVVGGSPSVRRRLAGLGVSSTVDDFRLEQLLWAGLGLVGGSCGMGVVTATRGGLNPLLVLVGAGIGVVGGVLGRDWWLSKALRVREQTMLAEFPVVADLLALAVVAGEAPAGALDRVCRLVKGELTRDIAVALARARAGTPLTSALADLAQTTTLEPFGRFLQGMVVAIERGTPMADVLRSQAADVREAGKRALLEAGGRKEVAMMIPVVFLILPVTVLFALYPGLLTLVSVTG